MAAGRTAEAVPFPKAFPNNMFSKRRRSAAASRFYEEDPLSDFFTANSAPWNPMRLWVPSQNGLLTDPPQRHKENAGLPVRSNLLPLASTKSTEPSGASTRYGPLGFTVIFT